MRPTGSAALQLLPQDRSERGKGEVNHPGIDVLPAGATPQDAIAAAGGVITAAFLHGTEFMRKSVQIEEIARATLLLRHAKGWAQVLPRSGPAVAGFRLPLLRRTS